MLDVRKTSPDLKHRYMNIFLSTWSLVVAGLVFSFPMIYFRIRDTTVLEDEGLYVVLVCLLVVANKVICIVQDSERSGIEYEGAGGGDD
jgi:hypothetical protein